MYDELRFFPLEGKLRFFLNSISIFVGDVDVGDDTQSIKMSNIDGILGKIMVNDNMYLLYVKESFLALDNLGYKIHRIKNIECANITSIEEFCKRKILRTKDKKNFRLVKDEFLNAMSHQSKDMENLVKFLNESPLYYTRDEIEDEKFLWNKVLRSNMNDAQNQTGIVYLYNGYFNVKACANFDYVLLSFISSNRVGPRYFSRGVDVEGNVSNFVKSKYLVVKNGSVIIDVIIYRGSVPVYWEQTGSLRELQCNEKDSFRACFKHFYNNFRDGEPVVEKQQDDERVSEFSGVMENNLQNRGAFTQPICHFNNILVINLLSNKKSEQKLSMIYKELLKNLNIQYLDFNLNKYHLNYRKLKHLFITELRIKINSIQERMRSCNNSYSKIIFRVNCLDCLDRTNLASYLICDYYHTQMEIPKNHLKTLFQENGNAISLFNAGSNALKNELAVKEKRSIKGLFDDFYIFTKRVISDKFNDKQKMEMIDTFLGRVKSGEPDSELVEQRSTESDSVFRNYMVSERAIEDSTMATKSPDSNANILSLNNFQADNRDESSFNEETALIITVKIASRHDFDNLDLQLSKTVRLIILCVNKVVSSLKSVFSEEDMTFRIKNFVLVSKKSYFNNHILIFSNMDAIKDISDIEYVERKRNLQFTKKNCLLAMKCTYKNTHLILFNVIMDKLYNLEFFEQNYNPRTDVLFLTGFFLNSKVLEIFKILNLSDIASSSCIKTGFKGNVTIKRHTENENANFVEFLI
ncbi:Inositol-1,4,5-triphosphate 5-phosphatase (synaptojanin), INP51/INP52/INP53 family [Trachipleistophora hominis]|uniref:Inositol-1,4,5-triphosphate 5-phosphatase (Synaptojanin), INP51/INP52/INP53 family n=1 Tax=Trachipleistophora hominis TaxID=72359 RepID=L7JZ25_TRAHO|nr:Inositol-1,4,5-triphosphate 5-phosphatase (synaptojanin), INP51/INP52/INP53 family [Trachipleistophora hominis]